MKQLKILFILFICASAYKVKAQDIVEKWSLTEDLKQKRTIQLSKKFDIPYEDASKLLALLDETTKNLNKIYNDSTLNAVQKSQQLKSIIDKREERIKQIIGDSPLSDQLLHRQDQQKKVTPKAKNKHEK